MSTNAVTLRHFFEYPKDYSSLGLCSHIGRYVSVEFIEGLLNELKLADAKLAGRDNVTTQELYEINTEVRRQVGILRAKIETSQS